ncbi:MAG: hypothetical protein AABW53_00290 [Nanoarchaeota archaeon]
MVAAVRIAEIRTVEPIFEPILLDNGLLLDGKVIRIPRGGYRISTQQGWEMHLAPLGKRLPTVGEYVAAIKKLHEGNDIDLARMLPQDLLEFALCTGTKIDYDKSNLPLGNGYLDFLVKDPAWKRALEDEIFKCDALETIDTIRCASGKRPYIWTSSAKSRKATPETAVGLHSLVDKFDLDCYDSPFSNFGRARGVREVGAEGACANEKDKIPAVLSATPVAETSTELEDKIAGVLSHFDQFKPRKSASQYEAAKARALAELKGLYKNG